MEIIQVIPKKKTYVEMYIALLKDIEEGNIELGQYYIKQRSTVLSFWFGSIDLDFPLVELLLKPEKAVDHAVVFNDCQGREIRLAVTKHLQYAKDERVAKTVKANARKVSKKTWEFWK